MLNRWNDQEAACYKGDLPLRVYTSRLLGLDPALVLHGGGNTSVKSTMTDILGKSIDVLYIKGSGWDLETIEEAGFPAVRMDHLLRLRYLKTLSDADMVNTQKTHMMNASSPNPSIETLLHAFLPFKFVDHTHSDAVVALTNVKHGEAAVREVYGDRFGIVPYVQPGFDLARVCAELFEKAPHSEGMILMKHGVFTFADSGKESYDRMIAAVQQAEDYLNDKKGTRVIFNARKGVPTPSGLDTGHVMAALTGVLRREGGIKLAQLDDSPRVMRFVNCAEAKKLSRIGPATPDHVIRTKALPLYWENPDFSSLAAFEADLAAQIDRYIADYKVYFETFNAESAVKKILLDPNPRVLLIPGLGMVTTGGSVKDAGIVADIYRHTIDVLEWAAGHGEYSVLTPLDLFNMEYWDLEQAKLRKGGSKPALAGRVAVVTGAASGIGAGAVREMLAQGAHVIGVDLNAATLTALQKELGSAFTAAPADITDPRALAGAFEAGARRYGRIDILFANAGVFSKSCTIEEMDPAIWNGGMNLNLSAQMWTLKAAIPYLKRSGGRADVVLMGSKNVPAPGPGAAAYSCAKAALTQLGRVAALELAQYGIRVNTVHPDAVFDTGVWTEDTLKARAAHYGLTVEQYKRKNLLKTEITSRQVGKLVADMCGPAFQNTTGAQVPVDGGNDRVI
ncbi:MAG: bifunctional aldolase/short-chain dehydrogenase [Nitrospirota bacterium]|nr:bifunctional aldolase/short-chain dehydrogenase [Nitrospirota bacterium]